MSFVRELFVDDNHIGRAKIFHTDLFLQERESLNVGDLVTVIGNAVEPPTAPVLALHASCAQGQRGSMYDLWIDYQMGQSASTPVGTAPVRPSVAERLHRAGGIRN
jgi:hypothetical protein